MWKHADIQPAVPFMIVAWIVLIRPFNGSGAAAERAEKAAAELLLEEEQEQKVKKCRQEAKQRRQAKAAAKNTNPKPQSSGMPSEEPIHPLKEPAPSSGWVSHDSDLCRHC